jgi:dipeptidyl aminopeptidase/acylaminoacyl peptidase
MVHGGPTAAASNAFSLNVQWWTSRGFGVAHVNHRGSTGFGRAYRQALYGEWGIADVEDCIAAARCLAGSAAYSGSNRPAWGKRVSFVEAPGTQPKP